MHRKVLVVGAVVLACTASSVLGFTGKMTNTTTDPGLVVGWDDASKTEWDTGAVSIQWWATLNADGSWRYKYAFSSPTPELSHLILEVSPSFRLSEILNLVVNGSSANVGDHVENVSTQNNTGGDSDMPESVYGIRFEVPENDQALTMTYQFGTFRVPVWADFLAKGGQSHAHDDGFTTSDSDPTDAAADGTGPSGFGHHLLPPDTQTTRTPEPGALSLLALGGVSLWARRRRG